MSASFGQRLRREFTAKPKKAAALGGLLIVAICFWAPLIKGWIAPPSATEALPAAHGAQAGSPPGASTPAAATPKRPAVPAPNVATQSVATATAGTAAATGTNATPAFPNGYTWRQIAAAIDADARMRPVVETIARQDIFPVMRETDNVAVKEPEPPPPTAAPANITPADAGLVLSSTIVGGGRPVALVSGRAYAVADNIKASKEGQSIVFTLVSVEAKQIVLENGGKRFVMKLQGSRLASDDRP